VRKGRLIGAPSFLQGLAAGIAVEAVWIPILRRRADRPIPRFSCV
jgi:hypothetical protein